MALGISMVIAVLGVVVRARSSAFFVRPHSPMPLTARIRPKPGDVIEIPTPSGFAYAHFTHKHKRFGALIRILPGLFPQPPPDFSSLVQKKAQFVTFFPLGAACNRQIVRVVAEETIPAAAQEFPLFRCGVRASDGLVHTWWLWDGEREWKIGSLKPDQHHLPVRAIWNDTLLVERILSGWRHEMET